MRFGFVLPDTGSRRTADTFCVVRFTSGSGVFENVHVMASPYASVGNVYELTAAFDGIVVPARRRERIRIRFADFVGATVQHCHILDHEDLGMMSTIQIEE